MSQTIDLSQLPSPQVVESLDYEALLEQRKQAFLDRVPAEQRADFEQTLSLDSEPIAMLLQENVYREILLRNRINEAARSVMLAYAEDADLDQFAANLGVRRKLISQEDPTTRPPTPAVYESDESFRRVAQLALEATTVAGSRQAYVFHTLNAHADVADAFIDPDAASGDVRVVVLSRTGDGQPADNVLLAVQSALSADDVRPLNDTVIVEAASIVRFSVSAKLHIAMGPSAEQVIAAAQLSLEKYLSDERGMGRSIAHSGIYAALHQPGVTRVEILEPAADILCEPDQAGYCVSISLSRAEADW